MISTLDQVRKFSFRSHVLWAFLAWVGWTGRQVWQWKQTGFFSWIVFLKGFLLLTLVSTTYGLACRRRPSFFLLGFFPLLWLATSRVQWKLCVRPDARDWIWLVVFILGEGMIFYLRDGRKLLVALGFLWSILLIIFPFSFFTCFSFGWIREGRRFKKTKWVCAGIPLLGLVGCVLFGSWHAFQFFGYELYQVFLNDRFIAFFFLGWLGMMGFSSKKFFWNPAFGPLFLLPLGYLWMAKPGLYPPSMDEILKWVLIFFAGFGWESFRRDVMDRSWHGKLLWFSLGLAFWGGLL